MLDWIQWLQRVSSFEIETKKKPKSSFFLWLLLPFVVFDNSCQKWKEITNILWKGLVISNNLFNDNIMHYNNTKRFHLYWWVRDLIRELMVNKCVESKRKMPTTCHSIDRCDRIINGIEKCERERRKKIMSNDAFTIAVDKTSLRI